MITIIQTILLEFEKLATENFEIFSLKNIFKKNRIENVQIGHKDQLFIFEISIKHFI